MERARTLSGTRVALLGGLLLLGLLAVAAFLLLSASPAGAQTDESPNGSEPAASDAGQAQEPAPAEPAEGERADAPPEAPPEEAREPEPAPSDSTEVRVSAPAPVDAIVEPVLPPVELVVPLSLPPVVPELPPAPVSVRSAPARPAPAEAATNVSVPPPAPESVSTGAEASTVPTTSAWDASPMQSTAEFRSGSSPLEGGTRALPFGLPPAVAAPGSSVSSSSAARDFGQSLLLFGIIAAGIMLILGRGRRLLIEATGWLRAPWCLLIERPG